IYKVVVDVEMVQGMAHPTYVLGGSPGGEHGEAGEGYGGGGGGWGPGGGHGGPGGRLNFGLPPAGGFGPEGAPGQFPALLPEPTSQWLRTLHPSSGSAA